MSAAAPGKRTETPEKSAVMAFAERLAATRQGAWLVIHVMNPIDRFIMKRTRGRRRRPNSGPPKLLLHHVGAKSGQPRQTPLQCIPGDNHWIIAASKGGDPKHPAWYFNVKANPAVAIDLDGDRIYVQARQLEGDEYAEAWGRARAQFAGFDVYQSRAGQRKIPLFRLDPRARGPQDVS